MALWYICMQTAACGTEDDACVFAGLSVHKVPGNLKKPSWDRGRGMKKGKLWQMYKNLTLSPAADLDLGLDKGSALSRQLCLMTSRGLFQPTHPWLCTSTLEEPSRCGSEWSRCRRWPSAYCKVNFHQESTGRSPFLKTLSVSGYRQFQ